MDLFSSQSFKRVEKNPFFVQLGKECKGFLCYIGLKGIDASVYPISGLLFNQHTECFFSDKGREKKHDIKQPGIEFLYIVLDIL